MKLRIGDQLQIEDSHYTVIALASRRVALRHKETGQLVEFDAHDLAQNADLKNQTHAPEQIDDLSVLAYLGKKEREDVEFWSQTLRQLAQEIENSGDREGAFTQTLERLARSGHVISARTLQRKRAAFQARGVAALIDQRSSNRGMRTVDPRVIEALSEVMDAQTEASTGRATRLITLATISIERTFGPGVVRLPSLSTWYRLVIEMDRHRHTTGSAKTRQSLANRPDREFSAMSVARPGEQVQIDSTKLDVEVRLPGGIRNRPELTVMVDVATRSIISAVIRPTTSKSVDLVVALARALVPFDARPGAAEMSRRAVDGAFDGGRLLPERDYAWYRRQMPYIFPQTITTDLGKIYQSEHFKNACEQLHISISPAAPRTPTDKPIVERAFGSINDGFNQYLKNYLGRSVEFRGTSRDTDELHTILEIQEILDEWVAVCWQTQGRDGLRDPLRPDVKLSPNEMCAALRELFPEVEVPFTADTYIRLLPVEWRTIQAYGVTVQGRTYDSAALQPIRGTKSSIPGHKGEWPVHYDPYNIQNVWLRNEDQMMPLQWKSGAALGPMSADVWKLTRSNSFFDERNASAQDISARRLDLLSRAGAGSAVKELDRAVARSRAVEQDTMRLSESSPKPAESSEDRDVQGAEIIPMPRPRVKFDVLNLDEMLEGDHA